MMGLIKKIKEFGFKVVLICSLSRLMRILRFPKGLINRYVNWKNRYVSYWLWKSFKGSVVSEVPKTSDTDDGYVFVFWLQGEHEAPPIVKVCISSIRKWCFDRKVVVLDKNNYTHYAPSFSRRFLRMEMALSGRGKVSDSHIVARFTRKTGNDCFVSKMGNACRVERNERGYLAS